MRWSPDSSPATSTESRNDVLSNVREVAAVLYGGSIFVVANGGLAYVAYLAGRRLFPEAGTRIRLTASGIVDAIDHCSPPSRW